MSRRDARSPPREHGDVLTAISDGMVALLKEFYGRGPTRTKTYYQDDMVVCLLRGGVTRVEQTLLEGGRGSSVIQQRMEFQELMRERFNAVIEAATGRSVIGFISGTSRIRTSCAKSSSSPAPTSSTTRSTRADTRPKRDAEALGG